MPFSQSSQISAIVGWVERLNPTRVLDVGVGMGQYGFLLRNFLENTNLFEVRGDRGWQRDRAGWRVVIDGIEGFEGYLTPVHAWAYSRVVVGDAIAVLRAMPDAAYEAVLAIDILEHFEREDGTTFLRQCRRVASRAALVSTPKAFIAQSVPANPLEDHRALWTQHELSAEGFAAVVDNEQSWIAVAEH